MKVWMNCGQLLAEMSQKLKISEKIWDEISQIIKTPLTISCGMVNYNCSLTILTMEEKMSACLEWQLHQRCPHCPPETNKGILVGLNVGGKEKKLFTFDPWARIDYFLLGFLLFLCVIILWPISTLIRLLILRSKLSESKIIDERCEECRARNEFITT